MAVLFADDCFLAHETGMHPESAKRLIAVYRHLDEIDLRGRFEAGPIDAAAIDVVQRVHSSDYIRSVDELARNGGGRLDADTVVCPESSGVALKAVGAAVAAVDAVVSGGHTQAVCLCRPPGHHALSTQGMGFCLFNNVAVAAQHALDDHQLSRVLIVDWDVHHGNGTQDIFYESDRVFFFSAHRFSVLPRDRRRGRNWNRSGSGRHV